MKAAIYLVGAAVLVAGIIYGMNVLGVQKQWIIVTSLVVGGLGIMGAARSANDSTKITKTTADSSGNSETSQTEVS